VLAFFRTPLGRRELGELMAVGDMVAAEAVSVAFDGSVADGREESSEMVWALLQVAPDDELAGRFLLQIIVPGARYWTAS